MAVADTLVLVDTTLQLTRRQSLRGERNQTATHIAEHLRSMGKDVRTLPAQQFQESSLRAHAVLSVCVYDAVPIATRRELALAAARNLRRGGEYVVIVPRNDTSITARCGKENSFEDGHLFCRGKSCTFYVNYRDHVRLIRQIESAGVRLIADKSSYRHVWLLFEKP
jgi:hypothetical protein